MLREDGAREAQPRPFRQSLLDLRYSPYFTDQFGLGIPLIADSPSGVDVNMETDFLDNLGSDLTIPGDFNWVSCRSYILALFI